MTEEQQMGFTGPYWALPGLGPVTWDGRLVIEDLVPLGTTDHSLVGGGLCMPDTREARAPASAFPSPAASASPSPSGVELTGHQPKSVSATLVADKKLANHQETHLRPPKAPGSVPRLD
nr:uncharacterized protein CTRU02_11480 [Colletotrichum truncatum]KAF6785855.1 hypothetical protein CTRU02_11480 [Colletotrichum truncatum]